MLKLLKHEIKATSRFFIAMYTGLIAISIIFNLFFGGLTTGRFDSSSDLYGVVSVLLLFLYFSLFIATFVGNIFMMAQRYYKNLYGDEGYLMHTLPVKSWQHVATKAIISGMWLLASLVFGMLSVFILSGQWPNFAEIFRELSYEISYAGFSPSVFYIQVIVFILLSLLTGMLPIFSAISIGQLWKKHRVLGAFICYIVINFARNIFTSMFLRSAYNPFSTSFYFASNASNMLAAWNEYFWFGVITQVIFSAIFMFVSSYLMQNKLNVE